MKLADLAVAGLAAWKCARCPDVGVALTCAGKTRWRPWVAPSLRHREEMRRVASSATSASKPCAIAALAVRDAHEGPAMAARRSPSERRYARTRALLTFWERTAHKGGCNQYSVLSGGDCMGAIAGRGKLAPPGFRVTRPSRLACSAVEQLGWQPSGHHRRQARFEPETVARE